jgi:hypothetical protein
MPLKPLQLNTYNRPALTFIKTPTIDMFDLDAPYQRPAVWGDAQRVALIKSMLLNLPIGAVYVNVRNLDNDSPYVIIDGKQRILAIRDFADSKFGVPADWFFDKDFQAPAEGELAHYRDLNQIGRNRLMMTTIATFEANVKTIEEEAEIFMLLNASGVAQTDETLANAASFLGAAA